MLGRLFSIKLKIKKACHLDCWNIYFRIHCVERGAMKFSQNAGLVEEFEFFKLQEFIYLQMY